MKKSYVEEKESENPSIGEDYILNVIDHMKWSFAKTCANTHPHEYCIRNSVNSEDFDSLCEYISKNSHNEWYFNKRGLYCSIESHTYWVSGGMIGRRRNDIYEVTANKRIVKVANWRELLNV